MADFNETIVALRNGAVVTELGDRLAGLIQAVRETEKSGSLTLQLKVVPAVSGSAEVVAVEAIVKVSTPQPSLGKSIFFTTEEGNLLRKDPKQMILIEEKS
jgi:hypothetical protein